MWLKPGLMSNCQIWLSNKVWNYKNSGLSSCRLLNRAMDEVLHPNLFKLTQICLKWQETIKFCQDMCKEGVYLCPGLQNTTGVIKEVNDYSKIYRVRQILRCKSFLRRKSRTWQSQKMISLQILMASFGELTIFVLCYTGKNIH